MLKLIATGTYFSQSNRSSWGIGGEATGEPVIRSALREGWTPVVPVGWRNVSKFSGNSQPPCGVAREIVTSESDKDRQFEDFLSGKVRVIANVSMLTEGFDQSDVQTVFARDASRLPTIQMCGRGLRRAEGKEFCNIVQSVNTSYLFERVTPARRRFKLMDGQWLALQDGTKSIEETLKQSLALLEQRERIHSRRRARARRVA